MEMEEGSRAGTVFSGMELLLFCCTAACILNIDLKVFLCQYETGRTQRSKRTIVEETTVLTKKYPNRRLYNTSSRAYVNLSDLAALIRKGEQVQVVDAKTG